MIKGQSLGAQLPLHRRAVHTTIAPRNPSHPRRVISPSLEAERRDHRHCRYCFIAFITSVFLHVNEEHVLFLHLCTCGTRAHIYVELIARVRCRNYQSAVPYTTMADETLLNSSTFATWLRIQNSMSCCGICGTRANWVRKLGTVRDTIRYARLESDYNVRVVVRFESRRFDPTRIQ